MHRNQSFLAAVLVIFLAAIAPSLAPAQDKPNIIFIMGDDIGMWNISAYHRGLLAGRTPHIDQLAAEGALFTDYYAEASCTAGRASFITGELPPVSAPCRSTGAPQAGFCHLESRIH
jgi:arylsulfatase A-like enzyme